MWCQDSDSYILTVKIKFGIKNKTRTEKGNIAIEKLELEKLYWH